MQAVTCAELPIGTLSGRRFCVYVVMISFVCRLDLMDISLTAMNDSNVADRIKSTYPRLPNRLRGVTLESRLAKVSLVGSDKELLVGAKKIDHQWVALSHPRSRSKVKGRLAFRRSDESPTRFLPDSSSVEIGGSCGTGLRTSEKRNCEKVCEAILMSVGS